MSRHRGDLAAGAQHTLRRMTEGWRLVSGYREAGRCDENERNVLVADDGTRETVNRRNVDTLVCKRLITRHGFPIGRYTITDAGRAAAQTAVTL